MKNEAFSIWLIGPSASGKTTVSQKIYELLSPHHKNIILLDGDHARKIFVNESGYDPVSRSNNIKKYVGVVKWLNSFGISTIVAAINAFEKDRIYCREKINNYFEVFLDMRVYLLKVKVHAHVQAHVLTDYSPKKEF